MFIWKNILNIATYLPSNISQRAKVSLPPLLFQMFSNSDCYTNKDKSKSSTIISQKILTIGKWLETVWTETNVDEIDVIFLTQYHTYTCQKLPWKSYSKKSDSYFAWNFSSIAMLSKEKNRTGRTFCCCWVAAGYCGQGGLWGCSLTGSAAQHGGSSSWTGLQSKKAKKFFTCSFYNFLFLKRHQKVFQTTHHSSGFSKS